MTNDKRAVLAAFNGLSAMLPAPEWGVIVVAGRRRDHAHTEILSMLTSGDTGALHCEVLCQTLARVIYKAGATPDVWEDLIATSVDAIRGNLVLLTESGGADVDKRVTP